MTAGGVVRCHKCNPLPGGEVIGIRTSHCEDNVTDDYRSIILHRRSCPEAIRMASKHGDDVVSITYSDDPKANSLVVNSPTSVTINRNGYAYPVTLEIRGVDRYHLLMDLVTEIADNLHLSIDSLNTYSRDGIAECRVTFMVHSVQEMVSAIQRLNQIDGVDSVYQDQTAKENKLL